MGSCGLPALREVFIRVRKPAPRAGNPPPLGKLRPGYSHHRRKGTTTEGRLEGHPYHREAHLAPAIVDTHPGALRAPENGPDLGDGEAELQTFVVHVEERLRETLLVLLSASTAAGWRSRGSRRRRRALRGRRARRSGRRWRSSAGLRPDDAAPSRPPGFRRGRVDRLVLAGPFAR